MKLYKALGVSTTHKVLQLKTKTIMSADACQLKYTAQTLIVAGDLQSASEVITREVS